MVLVVRSTEKLSLLCMNQRLLVSPMWLVCVCVFVLVRVDGLWCSVNTVQPRTCPGLEMRSSQISKPTPFGFTLQWSQIGFGVCCGEACPTQTEDRTLLVLPHFSALRPEMLAPPLNGSPLGFQRLESLS